MAISPQQRRTAIYKLTIHRTPALAPPTTEVIVYQIISLLVKLTLSTADPLSYIIPVVSGKEIIRQVVNKKSMLSAAKKLLFFF
jgi:hypothetical protein